MAVEVYAVTKKLKFTIDDKPGPHYEINLATSLSSVPTNLKF